MNITKVIIHPTVYAKQRETEREREREREREEREITTCFPIILRYTIITKRCNTPFTNELEVGLSNARNTTQKLKQ